jgi:hypothetical protein
MFHSALGLILYPGDSMKLLPTLLLAACVPSAFATSFTVTDPFNAPCSNSSSSSCDVMGDPLGFDIQKGVFNFGATSATIDLYFNFGLNTATSLSPFAVNSVVLSLGDLFLSGSGFNYGIALQTHNTPVSGNVTGGVLYQINNSNGVLTAAQALGNPTTISYRPTEIVWLRNDGAGSLTNLVAGSVSILGNQGNGVTAPEFKATITLNYAAGSQVATNLQSLTGAGVHFASATCGNDVMNGVPEPASLGLIGGGLLAFAGLRFRKSRQK